MLFTSLTFLVFLAIVVGIFHALPLHWRPPYLWAASFVFYCSWSLPFALLLLIVSLITTVLGRWIEASASDSARWRLLLTGVLILFTPLLMFKYVSAFGSVLAYSFALDQLGDTLTAAGVLAPIGLSYYTFKLVSYLSDVYWGRLSPSGFIGVAAYASFFPQILSGPIQRAGDFLRQIGPPRPTTQKRFSSGLRLLLFGFFKKMVIADRVGAIIDPIYVNPQAHPDLTVTVATYLFAVQVYADFSGLTDIARGVARLLGIQSPRNFNQPYYAENMQEFWRRWHMTLTDWVRNYIFLPLRMSLRNWGHLGLVVSVFVNMVLVGLWHGPWLTFVIFGLIHGTYVYGSSQTFRRRKAFYDRTPILKAIHVVSGPLITFHMLYVTLPFFRAGNLPDAWASVKKCIAGMLQIGGGLVGTEPFAQTWAHMELKWTPDDLLVIGVGSLTMEIIHALEASQLLGSVHAQLPGTVRWAGYYAMAISILIWGEMGTRQFIYAGF